MNLDFSPATPGDVPGIFVGGGGASTPSKPSVFVGNGGASAPPKPSDLKLGSALSIRSDCSVIVIIVLLFPSLYSISQSGVVRPNLRGMLSQSVCLKGRPQSASGQHPFSFFLTI
ncbi:hypothetical protein H1C71_004784 [Ictidomys tridecemlineatus]|nr:hypothetical protein H1C71_004784 [Ictidomys tridecemlineatus]